MKVDKRVAMCGGMDPDRAALFNDGGVWACRN